MRKTSLLSLFFCVLFFVFAGFIFGINKSFLIGKKSSRFLLPPVDAGTFPDVCQLGKSFLLTGGTPSGGYYTGPGVINGYFYPSSAGAGTHTLTYTVYIGGVAQTATTTIKVNPRPSSPSPIKSGTLPFVGTLNQNGGTACPNGGNAYNAPGCTGRKENYIIPFVPGTTYQWEISKRYAAYSKGGTIVGPNNGNSVDINWDANGVSYINIGNGLAYYTMFKITETNSFGCTDSFFVYFQISKSPVSGFTSSTVCVGNETVFTDKSTDAIEWFWDFGDGTTSTEKNPKHVFTSGGNHQVKLITKSGCYCADTIVQSVQVIPTPAPKITCPSTFCVGTSSSYSTDPVCGGYNWVVTGGTITSGQGTPNISVDWGPAGPTGTVSLTTSDCSPNQCSIPTTNSVPLIPPVSSITGKTKVCQSESATYTLPAFPGSNVSWSIVPSTAGTIVTGQGTNNVNVTWNTSGNAKIVVTIDHSILSCKSSASLDVIVLPYFSASTTTYSLCKGGSGTVTANPSGAMTWTIPSGRGTVTSGQGTGSATITWQYAGSNIVVAKPVTANQFCNDSSYTYVYVDSVRPPSVDGPMYICPGSTYKYSSLGPTSPYSYNWSATNGTVTGTSGNDVWIQWGLTGPYSITIVQNNGYAPYCASAPYVIPVYDLTAVPPPINGKDSTCVDNTYSYSVPYLSGASYSWSINPPQYASIITGQGTSGISLEFSSPGTAVITCSTTLCPIPMVSTFTVTINPSPKPPLSSVGYMCPTNGSVTLSTSPGFVTYSWSPSGGTGQTAIVTTAGYFIVYVKGKNGCIGKEKIKVPMQDAPIAHISTPDAIHYCAGETVNTNLHAIISASTGVYQWYKKGTPVGTNSPIYNATDTGTYWVVITNSYGCSSTSNPIKIDKILCGGGPSACIPISICGMPPCTPPPPTCISPTDTVDVIIEVKLPKKTNNGSNMTMATDIILKLCKNKINFRNTTNAPTKAWFWDFGDGATSLIENPTYTYAWPGYYYITFVGIFPNGLYDIKYQSIEIPFLAKYKIEANCGGAVFTDLSMHTTGSPITNWLWDFGDGTTSTAQHPTHSYPAPGTYKVKLTVSDSKCSNTDSALVVVPPPPVADFTAPSACITFPTKFTDNSKGTSLYEWKWEFGDGYISNNQNPYHTYGSPGNYNVKLTVTDVTGCSSSVTRVVVVSSPSAGASITANGPTTFCQGGSVLLTATPAASYKWSNGEVSQYILVKNGGYYSCTITFATGCVVKIPHVYVKVLSTPYAYMYSTSQKDFICAGRTATFNASSSQYYSYQWYKDGTAISGANTYTYQTTSTGIYSVHIVDTRTGCFVDLPGDTINSIQPSPAVPTITGLSSFCDGTTVTLTGSSSGGTAPLTYGWTNGSSQTSITVDKGGTYYLTVQDKNGCTNTSSKLVTLNPKPNLHAFPVGCYDICKRDTLRVIGGMASYQWYLNGAPVPPPAGTSQNMIVNADGEYSLIAKTNEGCIDTSGKVDITTKPLPIINAGLDATICVAGGELVSLKGTTDGLTYNWTPVTNLSNPNILNPIANPPSTTDYILHAKGSNGCKNSDTVKVMVSCTNPKVNVLGAITCEAGCVSLTATGGGGGIKPYTYNWSSGQTGVGPHSVCPTSTSIYTVTITDAAGNTGEDTALVFVRPGITSITTASVNVKCKGDSNGELSVTPSGGIVPYTYSWSTGATAQTITGLPANSYSVSIMDSLGCMLDTVLTLIGPDSIVPVTVSTPAVCGGNNGSVTVAVSGGTGPYTYLWSPIGGTGQTADNISPGNYAVTITDANNCTASTTAIVNNSGGMTGSIKSFTNVTCNGLSDGTAVAVSTGGTAPISFKWSPGGGTDSAAIKLSAGIYTVTITDANNCMSVTTVEITEPDSIVLTVATSDANCGGSNGSATVSGLGGAGSLNYLWTPGGATTPVAGGLTPGNYTVSVTDANGCTNSTSVIINNLNGPAVSINSTGAKCNGATNGSAIANVTGGAGPYTYSWQPSGNTTNSETNLSAGIYTVNVTDSAGCIIVSTVTVTEPPPISIIVAVTDGTCGIANGSAVATVTGAVGTITYVWSPSGVAGDTAKALIANTYTVLVTDANNCTQSTTAIVGNTPPVSVSATVVDSVSCNGGNDGSVVATSGGGTAPVTFVWLPSGGAGQTASALIAGNYTVSVTDSKGCTSTSDVIITEPDPIVLNVPPPSVLCIGQSTVLTAVAAGGTAGYNYLWMPGTQTGTNISVTPAITTTYTVTATDSKGCVSAGQTVTVNVKPPLQLDAGVTQTVCAGGSVTLSATATGGDGNFLFNWLPVNLTGSTVSVTPTGSTTYTVIVTDGCETPSLTDTVEVKMQGLPVPTFVSDTTSGCEPLCIKFTNTSIGTSANCLWDFGNGSFSQNCSPFQCYRSAGSYDVKLTIADSIGCTASVTRTGYINVFPLPAAAFDASPRETTILTPTIHFTDKSSTDVVKWDWNFGDLFIPVSSQKNPFYTYQDTGRYGVQLLVTNQYGCTDTATDVIIIKGDYAFYVPNAFTPNGDGKNETFFPKGLMINPECYKMIIFDRWGNLIFETSDLNTGWNGKANKGKEVAQQDVYVWKIETCDFEKSRHFYVGHVTLVK